MTPEQQKGGTAFATPPKCIELLTESEPADNLGEANNLVKSKLGNTSSEVPPSEPQAAVSEANGHAATTVLRGCPNESATIMTVRQPWTFAPDIPARAMRSKAAYNSWCKRPDAQHWLFSVAEGVWPDLRCKKQANPVRRLLALIAEYSADIPKAVIDAVFEKCPTDTRPNWLCPTFSGGVRAIWLFEEPTAFDNERLAKAFLKIAIEDLGVGQLFSGLNYPAWEKQAYGLFDVACALQNWRELSKTLLPTTRVHHLLRRAAQTLNYRVDDGIEISLETISKEVASRWPGAWPGEFAVGALGPVFWEAGSDPTRAAIVTETGMIALSSYKLFHSWTDVLGTEFVEKCQDAKINAAVMGVWFDGHKYYRRLDGAWSGSDKRDFTEHLCVNFKLDSYRARNETASETAKAAVFVRENRQVDGVIPSLFNPRDTIEINGKRFLNCSRVKPIQSHEEPQTWGTNFPWIARFLELRFDETERPYFLGWWKRFYGSALQGDLLKGHSLFIVGGVNLGKTLMSYQMVGASVGGAADASAHIVGGSEFNKELFEVALRCVDDGEVASNSVSHRKFSEAVKRMVANPRMTYRAMYQDSQSVDYYGRLLVTLNDDAFSLRMIPDLAISMEEKVMILKFQDTPYEFPPKHVLEPMIASELPSFLRWLTDWEIPDEIKGDNRLGVKSYVNEELRYAAMTAGEAGDLLEVIDLWKRRNEVDYEGGYWEGTASKWVALLSSDDFLKPLVTKFGTRRVGIKFKEAAQIRDTGIEVARASTKANIYRIKVK